MIVTQIIEKLKEYNPNAKVDVITNNKSYDFSFAFGSAEGCTKENCETVSFYVDDTCQSESNNMDKGGAALRVNVVPVNVRLPEEGYMVPLIYIYENGHSGVAIGYYREEAKSWDIEHSDDYPGSDDITHWLEIIFESNLCVDSQKLRRDILGISNEVPQETSSD